MHACMTTLPTQVRTGAEKVRGLEQELDALRKRPAATALPDDVQKQLSELEVLQRRSALQAQVCALYDVYMWMCVCLCVCVCVHIHMK